MAETTTPVSESNDLKSVLDITLQVSVELGRTRLLVQDILKLHKGSVIELQTEATRPLNVLVNGKSIGEGEVVVVNEKFGVRFTDILGTAQRIRTLGK